MGPASVAVVIGKGKWRGHKGSVSESLYGRRRLRRATLEQMSCLRFTHLWDSLAGEEIQGTVPGLSSFELATIPHLSTPGQDRCPHYACTCVGKNGLWTFQVGASWEPVGRN